MAAYAFNLSEETSFHFPASGFTDTNPFSTSFDHDQGHADGLADFDMPMVLDDHVTNPGATVHFGFPEIPDLNLDDFFQDDRLEIQSPTSTEYFLDHNSTQSKLNAPNLSQPAKPLPNWSESIQEIESVLNFLEREKNDQNSLNRSLPHLKTMADSLTTEILEEGTSFREEWLEKKLKWSLVSMSSQGQENIANISFQDIERQLKNLLEKLEMLQNFVKRIQNFCQITGARFHDCQFFQLLLVKLTTLHSHLLQNPMVVHQQPPPLIEKHLRKQGFCVSVRFLTPRKYFEVLQPVKFHVINKKQAQRLVDDNKSRQCTSDDSGLHGNVGERIGIKSAEDDVEMLGYEFRNAGIINVTRVGLGKRVRTPDQDDDGAESEKFCLKFSCKIKLCDGSIEEIWCCSRPFVFFTHVQYIPGASGTMFWDRFFKNVDEIPFKVRENVNWPELMAALKTHFLAETKTRAERFKDFHVDNLKKLFAKKLTQQKLLPDFEKEFVLSRRQVFTRTNHHDQVQQPSLWDWFFGVIKLVQTNEHVRQLWNQGYLLGFVSTEMAEHILRDAPSGSCLIRFSESVLTAVTMSMRPLDPNYVNKVIHVCYECDDLTKINFRRRITDSVFYSHVLHLGPTTNQGEGFGSETQSMFRLGHKMELFQPDPSEELSKSQNNPGPPLRKGYAKSDVTEKIHWPTSTN